MGHWCAICGRVRANEQFSGRGHKTHRCKACQALPKQEIEAIEHQAEIFHFMTQRHISDKNVARLRVLLTSNRAEVAMLAALVLEVAAIKPYTRKRIDFIGRANPELLKKLEATGLIDSPEW